MFSKLTFFAFFCIIILKDVSSYSNLACQRCNSANKADCDFTSRPSKLTLCHTEYDKCYCISVASLDDNNATIYTRGYYIASETVNACDQLDTDSDRLMLYYISCDYEYVDFLSHDTRYCNEEDFPPNV